MTTNNMDVDQNDVLYLKLNLDNNNKSKKDYKKEKRERKRKDKKERKQEKRDKKYETKWEKKIKKQEKKERKKELKKEFGKDKKSFKKEWKNEKKLYKNGKNKNGKKCGKKNKDEKIKIRINKIIDLCQRKAHFHETESIKFVKKQSALQQLLIQADGMDYGALKMKLKEIVKKDKVKRKKRQDSSNIKDKLERIKRREQKRKEKMKRKEIKKQKRESKLNDKLKLENERIKILPKSLNNKEHLIINIDGTNIMGCDKQCRNMLRSRKHRGAKKRLIKLVSSFLSKYNLNIGYEIKVNLWFDGKGNINNNAFPVLHSRDVDESLVKQYTNNINNNVIVITSDRVLSLRLFKCNVKVMKSGVFYKNYLTQNNENNNEKNKDITANGIVNGPDNNGDMKVDEMNANNNNADGMDEDDDTKMDGNENDGDVYTVIEMPFENMRLADTNDADSSDAPKDYCGNPGIDESDEDDDDEGSIDDDFDVIEMELEGVPDEVEGSHSSQL